MKKRITELTGVKEIARRANVSIATVDRVLHNRKGVSKQTKEKITQIIDELNYKPNLLAQRLASRKTLRLATLIPESSKETSFWDAPLKGIEQADEEIKQFGIIVNKYFYDQNLKSSFVEQTKIILDTKPDGILLAPSFIEESVTFTNQCKELNIPYVLIDSDLPNNISREIDNQHHLLKKEEGFRAYYQENNKTGNIIKLDIKDTDIKSIERDLAKAFNDHSSIKVVFVTNSRVSKVAQFIENNQKDVILIGYDFLKENIDYMDRGIIDFLVCQKPKQQGYRGLISLYQHLAFGSTVEKIYFMPIDILTKENSAFYRN